MARHPEKFSYIFPVTAKQGDIKMTLNILPSTLLRRGLLTTFILLLPLIAGCASGSSPFNDESEIVINNYDDDHSYRVELHLASDDSYVDSLGVDEYPEFDSVDDFEDVPDGRYYLSIFRDEGETETNRSRTFTIEDDEDKRFKIEDDGEIVDM
jgi:hypothetical protein